MALSKTQQLVNDLKRLIKKEARVNAGLPPEKVRDEIPCGVGRALAAKSGKGTSGLAFPLNEVDATKRQFHPDRYLWDTSGIYSFVHGPIKTATFKDSSNSQGDINYGDPDG